MSEEKEVEVEGLNEDNANMLLAAAVELDMPLDVVKTSSRGVFLVPESVAKKAGLAKEAPKKTAAKKTAAKKAAAPKPKE